MPASISALAATASASGPSIASHASSRSASSRSICAAMKARSSGRASVHSSGTEGSGRKWVPTLMAPLLVRIASVQKRIASGSPTAVGAIGSA